MSLWDKGDGGALIVRDGLLERSVWDPGAGRKLGHWLASSRMHALARGPNLGDRIV